MHSIILGSQESSIFLRESSVVDAIIPSAIPIALNELHQSDSVGAPQHVATKVSLFVENSVLSVTSTLHRSGDANVLPADSSTQYGSKASEAEKFALSMVEDDADKNFVSSLWLWLMMLVLIWCILQRIMKLLGMITSSVMTT